MSQQFFHANVDYDRKFTITVIPPSINEILDCLKNNKTPITLKFGIARLHPDDQYCKKTGREVSTHNIQETDFFIQNLHYNDYNQIYSFSLGKITPDSKINLLFEFKKNTSHAKLITVGVL